MVEASLVNRVSSKTARTTEKSCLETSQPKEREVCACTGGVLGRQRQEDLRGQPGLHRYIKKPCVLGDGR